MTALGQKPSKERLEQIMKRADTSGELGPLMTVLGQKPSKERFEQIMKRADTSGKFIRDTFILT